jgi:hypothetical protein
MAEAILGEASDIGKEAPKEAGQDKRKRNQGRRRRRQGGVRESVCHRGFSVRGGRRGTGFRGAEATPRPWHRDQRAFVTENRTPAARRKNDREAKKD